MPDEKITEQPVQLTIDDEAIKAAEDAFSEDEDKATDGGKATPPEGDDKTKPDEKDKSGDKSSGKSTGEDPLAPEKKDPDEKDDKKGTAADRLKKRIESMSDDELEPDPEKKTPEKDLPKKESDDKEDKPEDKKQPEKEPEKPWTKEKIAEHLKSINDDDLPGEVIIDDTTVNLKEYAEDNPEEFATIKVVASAIAKQMIEDAVKQIPKAETKDDGKASEIDEKINTLTARLAQSEFDGAVARVKDENGNLKHPDYYDIVYGSDRENFHEWIKIQDEKTQKLATSLNSNDGDLVISTYKEAMGKKSAAAHDKKTDEEKERIDKLHKETPSKKAIKKPENEADGDPGKEAEDAFNEDD